MKDVIVTRNADRMGVQMGAIFALLGLFGSTILHDNHESSSLLIIAAICGFFGFGLPRMNSYSFPLDDPLQERIARRLSAFYLGAWAGGAFAVVVGGLESTQGFLVFAVTGTLVFGVMHFVFMKKRRYEFDTAGFGYDLNNPVKLEGRLIWFPFAFVGAVTLMAFGTSKALSVACFWAAMIHAIPELHPRLDTGVWRWIGAGWVGLCLGVILYAVILM